MAKWLNGQLKIAVIGTGVSGLSAAWLLSHRHDVTVYEKAVRLGGHANTIDVADQGRIVPVDMGFIVYNPETYPNLTALFEHLDVPTEPSDMSFAVSLRRGSLEYAGTDLAGLFAQKRNIVSPRFWFMLRDLIRFYRDGTRAARLPTPPIGTLGDFLAVGGYGEAFIKDHLLPMAAAIWSTPCAGMLDHPAAAFLRFCDNHGLLRLTGRPEWRTVTGGSRTYVERLSRPFSDKIRLGEGVSRVRRYAGGVEVVGDSGESAHYDHVVIATHADQALSMLADPSDLEHSLLKALPYSPNDAVMHRDPSVMPKRKKVWSSWNYVGDGEEPSVCATYFMNKLQTIGTNNPVFVTLNPRREIAGASIIHREAYSHPMFDAAAMSAQRRLWSLQGLRRTWYCGAHFGAGFHEDGLQAGLAVAEALGEVRRPWSVPGESERIRIGRHPVVIAA